MEQRSPIVTVLGHVDHGKTSLLDAIRKSNVASREAGGITQKIGASQVTTSEGKKITFIDTPGHAAFAKMRGRGARVADIALLVVSATDGPKPQTIESLSVIKEANIPFIVVITKTDLPSASVENVLGQLEKASILFEGRGGDIPFLSVSAKKGEKISELLELISLMAEVAEIKADKNGNLEAVVIETTKDQRGPVASVVVRNGTLKVGETVFSGEESIKVRGLFDESGKSVKEVFPGEPAQILGFEKIPEVGSTIKTFAEIGTHSTFRATRGKLDKDELPVAIKTDNAGSLEAILANLPPKIVVVSSGVGDIFESDVLEAKALGAKRIFAFESKVAPSVKKLADAEGITIEKFAIIYELFQKMEELLASGQVDILGKAEIIAEFPFNNRRVAGSRVTLGRINKADAISLLREEKLVGKVKLVSLKKQRNEVNEVKAGEQFGALFEPQLDFKLGDMLVSVRK